MKVFGLIAGVAVAAGVCCAADDDGIAEARALATKAVAAVTNMPAQVQDGGSTNEAVQPMTITATRMEYDYKESVALFDENVVVSDARFNMQSDKMIVFFEGTNDMSRLVVMGNVSISNENRLAHCDKAVYSRADGRIVMTGTATLQRTGQGEAGKVTGDRITIWLDEERIEVYPAATLTLPGGALDDKKGLTGKL